KYTDCERSRMKREHLQVEGVIRRTNPAALAGFVPAGQGLLERAVASLTLIGKLALNGVALSLAAIVISATCVHHARAESKFPIAAISFTQDGDAARKIRATILVHGGCDWSWRKLAARLSDVARH